MLPKPTPEGYRLIYAGFKDVNPSKFNFEIALSMFTKLMIITVMSEGACPGYAFVFDIKGIVLAHLASVSISLVRRYLYFVQVNEHHYFSTLSRAGYAMHKPSSVVW